MKKIHIIFIIIIAILSFSVIAYHGFKYTRGVPVVVEERKNPIVEVHFLNKIINLDKGIDESFWSSRPSKKIELLYQMMVIPWPKKGIPDLEVKAFRNRTDIYIYLEWSDVTRDGILQINEFTDASAVLFPLGKNPQTSTLMMGFLGKANIWHWRADQDSEYWLKRKIESKAYVDFYYPFEEEELFIVSKEKYDSAANDLLAIRVGTVTKKPLQNVEGRGIYSDGTWRVVFKRALNAIDAKTDAQFSTGKQLCAFAVWNGSKGDRGGRKSISDWVELEIK